MSSPDEICVLCCREIKFYAVGHCDHHVCYECSTRMRVLCEQNECPICRSDMPYVIFTRKKMPYSSPETYKLHNKQYTIVFEDRSIQDSFHQLLKHSCEICSIEFDIFNGLKNHMRSEHSLFYCELCVKHLKIFSFERKCYSRKDLAYHNRKGDIEDTSHRGHPLCEFCDERFVDRDELFRHLRREHFFCHFCDADGVQSRQFYEDYSYLKIHFRKYHYLCEEGECAQEKFVAAFRTEIDFKAHIALKHSKNKSKAELLQTRTLGLEFSITPRNVQNGNVSPNHREQRHNRQIYQRKEDESRPTQNEVQEPIQTQNQTFNMDCVQDFPSLVNNTTTKNIDKHKEGISHSDKVGNASLMKRNFPIKPPVPIEHFPALIPSNNRQAISQQLKPTPQVNNTQKWGKTQENKPKQNPQSGIWATRKGPNKKMEEDFPKLKTKQIHQYIPEAPEDSKNKLQQNKIEAPYNGNKQLIAEDLYQKIKSKRKNKNNTTKSLEEETLVHNDTELPDLTKLYTGFGSHMNLIQDESLPSHTSYDPDEKAYKFMPKEDDIPWRENITLVEEDFPPLGPSVAAAKYPPPGFGHSNVSAAPPGFQEKWQPSSEISSSYISLSSIAQHLTSKRETSTEHRTLHSYEQPFDFDKRNGLLIKRIFEFVDRDNKLFDEFKCLSGSFRKHMIEASEYHKSCVRILGKNKFSQLFPELLCLLPDIEKQQQLLNVHNIYLSKDSKKKGALPKQKGSLFSSLITICPICQQVLMSSDSDSHQACHNNAE